MPQRHQPTGLINAECWSKLTVAIHQQRRLWIVNSPCLLQYIDRDRLQLSGVDRKLNRALIRLSEGSAPEGIGFKQYRQHVFLTFGVRWDCDEIIATIAIAIEIQSGISRVRKSQTVATMSSVRTKRAMTKNT